MTFDEWFESQPPGPVEDVVIARAAWNAAVTTCSEHIAGVADYYSEKIFRPIPDEKKAKDGVAADLLREMLPVYAKSLRDFLS